jgi:hypothetical protein
MASTLTDELAAAAARLIVEDGMEYGAAKRKAVQSLGRTSVRTPQLPSNERVEEEVRAYIELYCADTQPAELAALRSLALKWMERLAEFRPHLTGAVWRGTATRASSIHLQLYCDDSKATEIELINRGISYDVAATRGPNDAPVDVLRLASHSPELGETVTLFLTILDHDDLRGALRQGADGRTERGDAAALRRLLEQDR